MLKEFPPGSLSPLELDLGSEFNFEDKRYRVTSMTGRTGGGWVIARCLTPPEPPIVVVPPAEPAAQEEPRVTELGKPDRPESTNPKPSDPARIAREIGNSASSAASLSVEEPRLTQLGKTGPMNRIDPKPPETPPIAQETRKAPVRQLAFLDELGGVAPASEPAWDDFVACFSVVLGPAHTPETVEFDHAACMRHLLGEAP